jgi:hypothetical protein
VDLRGPNLHDLARSPYFGPERAATNVTSGEPHPVDITATVGVEREVAAGRAGAGLGWFVSSVPFLRAAPHSSPQLLPGFHARYWAPAVLAQPTLGLGLA